MIYGLDIIILVQQIQGLIQLFDIFLISQLHPCLGDHGHLRLSHGDACLLQSKAHAAEVIRVCDDLVAVLLLGEVLGACVQSVSSRSYARV